MEDSEKRQLIEDCSDQPIEVNEPHKIHCEECDGYKDCPRMRGIDRCLGAAKWEEHNGRGR